MTRQYPHRKEGTVVQRLLLLATLCGCLNTLPSQAQELPVFDAHIHYSQADWEVLSPAQVLAILDHAGVRWALVSSTPDEGTLKLYDAAPHRIIPCLRPYRSQSDMRSWHSDPTIQSYVEERLQRGVYKGIGEFHLAAEHVNAPVVQRFAALAEQQQLFLHAHVDAAAVEKMLQRYPHVRILWAHAGMSATAETVGRLLDRFTHLWVELSLRTDVAPNDTLAPDWRALFLRHPDRFLVGTDTWMTRRWDMLVTGMQQIRTWLGQLPPEVAAQIAHRNGERLFGSPVKP
jgi:hypothetical protein